MKYSKHPAAPYMLWFVLSCPVYFVLYRLFMSEASWRTPIFIAALTTFSLWLLRYLERVWPKNKP